MPFSELEDCKNHFYEVRDPWISASSRAKTYRASPRRAKSSSCISTESAASFVLEDPWRRHGERRGNREVTCHFCHIQFSRKGWMNSKVCGMHGTCVYSSDCCMCMHARRCVHYAVQKECRWLRVYAYTIDRWQDGVINACSCCAHPTQCVVHDQSVYLVYDVGGTRRLGSAQAVHGTVVYAHVEAASIGETKHILRVNSQS